MINPNKGDSCCHLGFDNAYHPTENGESERCWVLGGTKKTHPSHTLVCAGASIVLNAKVSAVRLHRNASFQAFIIGTVRL